MLVVEVPNDLIASSASNVQSPKEEAPHMIGEPDNNVHSCGVGLEESATPKCPQIIYDATKDSVSIRIDISFKSPSHTGFQTTQLVSLSRSLSLSLSLSHVCTCMHAVTSVLRNCGAVTCEL
jgi:hypothetical protein